MYGAQDEIYIATDDINSLPSQENSAMSKIFHIYLRYRGEAARAVLRLSYLHHHLSGLLSGVSLSSCSFTVFCSSTAITAFFAADLSISGCYHALTWLQDLAYKSRRCELMSKNNILICITDIWYCLLQ